MLKVLIVNYNTQLLTDCCIKSVNKHTPNCHIYVFDNSDEKPFVNTHKNVSVIDNTKKQYIDFDEFLSRYPMRFHSMGARACKSGSAKHCYTIDKAFDIIGDNFVLLDSDVIVKRDLNEIADDNYIFVGDVITQPLTRNIKRVLPFVCYINVKMCKEKGVPYFDDDYMHGIWHIENNPESDKYDTGGGFYFHAQKYPYKTIKHQDYVFHYKGGSWDDRASRIAYKNGTDEDFVNAYRTFWDDSLKKVIYTCISGPYDRLREPKYIEDGYDYICFTDQNFTSNIWNFRPIPEELDKLSQVKKQRCIKILPHLFLPEYDFSVWVDASVEIKGSIDEYMEKNTKSSNGYFYVGEHPQRNCIYDEGKAVVLYKKDVKENVEPQMTLYKQEGMPAHYGLPQTCIVIRKHMSTGCIELDNAWWKEVLKHSHRDQLSFSYAMWKTKANGVVYLKKDIFNCDTFRWFTLHTPLKTGTQITIPKPVQQTTNELSKLVQDIVKDKQKERFNCILD